VEDSVSLKLDSELLSSQRALSVIPGIGEALVKLWAATILDFAIRTVAVITPAIKIPMITITAESSIKVKAEVLFFMIFEEI
jgi:hypothetical protein